jgi:hypothetical protein
MPYDWYSSNDDNKKIRRDAADSFLSAVLDNADGIGDAVTGMEPEKRQNAREELDRRLKSTPGGGALPEKVEVICIEADTRKMSDLVVFVLYKKGATIKEPEGEKPAAGELWRKRWVAAWAPY